MIDMDNHANTLPYFLPILPWQATAWQQLVGQIANRRLSHALLAGGMAGIGKRAFVWRLVAYLLCQNRTPDAACGQCDDCHWLSSGTHPDLLVLPASAMPNSEDEPQSIKIDDIRNLQVYCQTKSANVRIVVLDGAENLTVAAANALLKTLEEPPDDVFLILISDNPAKLLPTIKSRVQYLPLSPIDRQGAMAYLMEQGFDAAQADGYLTLSDGAVLKALDLPNQAWFAHRKTWLITFVALYHQQRTATAASEYWQGVLNLSQFCQLSRAMLMDIWRVLLGLPSLHADLSVSEQVGSLSISFDYLQDLFTLLDDIELSVGQNVQERFAYDRLMAQFSPFTQPVFE